jgi:hypothetical protein
MRGTDIKVYVEPPTPAGTNERFNGRESFFGDEKTRKTASR